MPQSGHIDIIRPDGSRETVDSSNQNCLFHAVIQATTNDPNDVVQQKAVELRRKVSEEILSKPHKYVEAVKIQNMFNYTNRSNKFKIEAGANEEQKKAFSEYAKGKNIQHIINYYRLGDAGTYKNLLNMEKATPGVVEADHIPPKDSVNKFREFLKNNPAEKLLFGEKHKELYKLVMSTENDKLGKQLICMNALHWDHQRALTSGNSAESKASRHLLTETLTTGDMEKVLKQSLILAHPESSDKIRRCLGTSCLS
ncbi:hypothetical protein PDJAM_G00195850 [Pangasius djambal]|uniref:Uncharacterized protein n=1 Tax=Pangasius djambal TaxID=1691987 RepID=A0ACC5Y5W2_9TELE|nr:hypothetical protein [Pangasius djambal]